MKGEKVLKYTTMYAMIFAAMTQLTETWFTLFFATLFMVLAITMAIQLTKE